MLTFAAVFVLIIFYLSVIIGLGGGLEARAATSCAFLVDVLLIVFIDTNG